MSTESIHELDPDGDVLLILHSRPCQPYQVKQRVQSEGPLTGHVSENAITSRSAVGDVAATESVVDHLEEQDRDSVTEADEGQPRQKRLIRASTRHLILASAVFKRLFHVSFKEGCQLSSQGYTELLLPDDDPAALLVLLQLIHSHIRKVPRTVDLRTFTETAILVDKYELLETTELVADHWFQALANDIPSTLNENLLPWICISSVFKKPEIFKKVTKVAQLESEGRLEVDYLPIPQSALDKINDCREHVLREVLKYLQDVLERYQGSQRICHEGLRCDAMLLGSLSIGLKELNILQAPQPPYDGISVRRLFERLRKMELPQYCDGSANKYSPQNQESYFLQDYDDYYPKKSGKKNGRSSGKFSRESYSEASTCEGVKGPLQNRIKELEQQLQGLELPGFASS